VRNSADDFRRFTINGELSKLCDEGDIENYDTDIIDSLGESFLKALSG